jgi:hypothetical protein
LTWYLSSRNQSPGILYVEETVSRARVGWVFSAIGIAIAVGGGAAVYFWGTKSVTQNWMALAAMILAIFLVATGVYAK